jgi:predicted metal-dependent peptidase
MESKLSAAQLDKAREILATGRLIAKGKAPYFRALLLAFVTREIPGLGTIGVTQNGIVLWDPEFILKCTPDQVGGLWLHEVMHRLNRHAERRGSRDPKFFNMAGDLAINPAIIEMGAELPGGAATGLFPEQFKFPRGLTADEYYDLLIKQSQQQTKQGESGSKKAKGDKGQGQGSGKSDGDEDGEDASGEGDEGNDANHDHAGGGEKPQATRGWCGSCAGRALPEEPEDNDPDGRTQGELDRANKEVAEAIQAEIAQKGVGRVPMCLRRWAEDALKTPKVPWRQRLSSLARRAVAWRPGAVDHRYDGPSRRQAALGFGVGRPILPRLRTPVPRVALVVDTSGSMGSREIEDALTEARGILEAVGAEVTFVACDADVHELRPVSTVRDAMRLLKGGGGTDFRPAFEALSAVKPRPEVVIFATDGYGPAPHVQPPGMNTIWLLVGGNKNPPAQWGDVVVVED